MQCIWNDRLRASLAAVLLASGCAGEVAKSALDDENVTLPPGAVTLASLELSPTHSVKFYDLGDGQSLIAEATNMDLDQGSAITQAMVEEAALPQVYARLAGDTMDPGALARLEAFEARRPLAAPGSSDGQSPVREIERPEFAPQQAQVAGLVDKDNASDAYFFSNKWCGGCMGWLGQKLPYMPQDRPVCISAPEACVTGAASPYRMTQRSKNMKIGGYNQSSSGTGLIKWWLPDPCENDGGIFPLVCRKGGSLLNFVTQPRTAYGFWTHGTNGSSWTRTVEWSGPGNIGFVIDWW